MSTFSLSSTSAPRLASAPVPPTLRYSKFQLSNWPLEIMERAANRISFVNMFGPKAASTRYPFRALRYWWAAAALADHVRSCPPMPRLLDAGCQGGFLKCFADSEFRAHWTALDCRFDHPHLARAAYDAQVETDLEKPLPFAEQTFDAVVSLHVFEHLRRPDATLREYARIVRSGGIVLLAFPTMPGWLAPLREAQHRREIAAGARPTNGHQQVFHPARCEAMASSAGFKVELMSGSHLFRKTGALLENFAAWVRLNQWWGGLFPALGSELCVVLRRN